LPLQIPGARIFAYGYDSSIAFSKSVALIDDFGKDLLVRFTSERRTVKVILTHQDQLLNQLTV
jgi:hypothetical protein